MTHMRIRIPATTIGLLLLALSAVGLSDETTKPPPAERDTPKGEKHYAVARVIQDYKDPYSFAQLEPAPFTIPKGYVATKLTYRWEDPKTDRKNDRLTADSIYSVTLGKYITEDKHNPDFVLAAGDYKLVCGGMVGATGVLGYTLIRGDLVDRPNEPEVPARGERVIEVVIFPRGQEERKFTKTYFIQGTKVTGELKHTFPAQSHPGLQIHPQPVRGSFEGTYAGNVITGTWESKFGPWNEDLTRNDGGVSRRVCTFTATQRERTVLNVDRTISESGTLTAVLETQYDASWYKPNEHTKIDSSSSYPSKDIPAPKGTWKERK